MKIVISPILQNTESRHRSTVVNKTIYGEFRSFSNDLITEQLIYYSAHTRNELAMVRRFCRSGDVILDVGAHIGTYAIGMVHTDTPRPTVYAFEGNSENYDLLCWNIERNRFKDCIFPINAIVTDKLELMHEMQLPDSSNTGSYFYKNPRPKGRGIQNSPSCGSECNC